MKGKAWSLVAFLLLIHLQSFGASSLLPLRSFGFPESAAANPYAELIESTNGMLYGTAAGGSIGAGAVFRIHKDGAGFLVLKRFDGTSNEGRRPFAAVIEGSDGALYGTTVSGGESNLGTVFRLEKDGTGFATLKSFVGTDGAYPEARLLEATDGMLYGTTSGGGTNDFGVVFRMGKVGSGFELLQRFTGTNGANPESGLMQASDGLLYGTTYSGGTSNRGTVFRVNTNGTGFAVLKSFVSAFSTNGHAPLGGLVEGTNGTLYGTTSAGGTNSTGTIFSLNKDGSDFRTLRSFGGVNGQTPQAGLLRASDGFLYGTTSAGGTNSLGVVFRIEQSGSNFNILTNLVFAPGTTAVLLEGKDGKLYGTSPSGGDYGYGTVFSLSKAASDFAVLKSLHESGGDGQSSYAALAVGTDGWLYGTTRGGGTPGQGTVFAIQPKARDYRILWSFDGVTGGSRPFAGLVEGSNGMLYGVSEFSGKIFSIEKSGANFGDIYSFTGVGRYPRGALFQADDGLLYGTASSPGPGVVYRVTTGGASYTVLKQFTISSTDGMDPMQALIQARDKQLYGTTPYGNISSATPNNGVVFKLSKTGSGYTVLKSFSTASQGANPMSPLLEASDGLLYGTTYGGGTSNNAGVVFRINTNGTGFQVLRSFIGVAGDGRHPCGKLVEYSDGAIYGTTERGGDHDEGMLFKIGKDGSGYAVLGSFSAAAGRYPRGGLVIAPDGCLYGTTDQGGTMGFGTIFRYGPVEVITDFRMLGSHPTLTFIGLPGTNYWIERATNLSVPAIWATLGATNTPADGGFKFSDETDLAREAYYRLRR